MTQKLDDIDLAIVRATQGGLALTQHPYDVIAEQVGISAADVMARFERMLTSGAVRRIGAVPNHYALGFTANGMTVWDVSDDQASALGRAVGALDFVSHAYLRPRHLPDWPYNLFAMVHGRDKQEVEAKTDIVRKLLGSAARGGEVLYSKRILKKTGLRLVA
jgi:DNA-binding Lrp family transcriptional regulator